MSLCVIFTFGKKGALTPYGHLFELQNSSKHSFLLASGIILINEKNLFSHWKEKATSFCLCKWAHYSVGALQRFFYVFDKKLIHLRRKDRTHSTFKRPLLKDQCSHFLENTPPRHDDVLCVWVGVEWSKGDVKVADSWWAMVALTILPKTTFAYAVDVSIRDIK